MNEKRFLKTLRKWFRKDEVYLISKFMNDDCRNAFILSLYDRKTKKSHTERAELERFLNRHPDKFTQDLKFITNRHISISEQLQKEV